MAFALAVNVILAIAIDNIHTTHGGFVPEQENKFISKITTPRGAPPFLLEGTDPAEIDIWAKKIAKTGPFAMNAIMYWVRYSYETSSKEYKVITSYLRESAKRLGIQYIPSEGEIRTKLKKKKAKVDKEASE